MTEHCIEHDRDPGSRFFVFDMFETIVCNTKGTVEPIFETLCGYYPGVEPSEISHCYHAFTSEFKQTHQNMELGIDEIVRHLDRTFGFRNDPRSMEGPLLRDNHLYTPAEGVEDVLRYLRGYGYRIAILSNTRYHSPTLKGILEDYGLGGYFDAVIASADIGYRKPRIEAYKAAADALGAPVHKCYFAGDSLSRDYYGPLSAGYRAAVLIDSKGDNEVVNSVRRISEIPYLFSRSPTDVQPFWNTFY